MPALIFLVFTALNRANHYNLRHSASHFACYPPRQLRFAQLKREFLLFFTTAPYLLYLYHE
jgi:hypothetical protein